MKKSISVLVLFVLMAMSAFAQHLSIDRRTNQGELGQNYITFYSYPRGSPRLKPGNSPAGHAWVGFKVVARDGTSFEFLRGLDREEILPDGRTIPSGMRAEDPGIKRLATRSLTVQVNTDTYKNAEAVYIPGAWIMGYRDCVTYAANVARAIGLRVGILAEPFPDDFLITLQSDNR